ncbi:N(4)-(Beta-N-acetylglucosaminyl)-L-asparaginase-like isoform X2 [Macrotis lagotis]|uniref:N(4)-(Beta-N-acetylglucosaminyl)-L-asparaginase- like isoform X2 n=1 Tax=Macrotis lagotis TaxID=92651 RepID=UPI003D680FE3
MRSRGRRRLRPAPRPDCRGRGLPPTPLPRFRAPFPPCSGRKLSRLRKDGAGAAGSQVAELIALDILGNITVGISTSGSPFKYPGRVGDSPLPGCGLYADYQVGAAAATGERDKIMCFCPCFHVVLLMQQGLSPKKACESVLKYIIDKVGDDNMFEFGIIAMNIKVSPVLA